MFMKDLKITSWHLAFAGFLIPVLILIIYVLFVTGHSLADKVRGALVLLGIIIVSFTPYSYMRSKKTRALGATLSILIGAGFILAGIHFGVAGIILWSSVGILDVAAGICHICKKDTIFEYVNK